MYKNPRLGLSREAISFLNAQNDYFGPGGEYIADRIEQDFDLRWDYKRARHVMINFENFLCLFCTREKQANLMKFSTLGQ